MTSILCTRSLTVYSSCRQGSTLSFRRYLTGGKLFADGDHVLLRYSRKGQEDVESLVKLRKDQTRHTTRGVLYHNDLIGKRPRDSHRTHTGSVFRLHEPTLADYCRLSPRLCTPIYPSEANTIVSALDIHVPSSEDPETPPLEILESGTGHGSLTLHLARAIHGANPSQPPAPHYPTQEHDMEDATYSEYNVEDVFNHGVTEWKKSRRAVVHTIDIRHDHAKRAEETVKGFRRGLYAANVEFYVDDVSSWILKEQEKRGSEEPFLSHVVLDMPSADVHLPTVAKALRVDGVLAIFNPSITQIADCVKRIRLEKLPFVQDEVIELAPPRPWDVLTGTPKKRRQPEAASASSPVWFTEDTNQPRDGAATETTPEREEKDKTSAHHIPYADTSDQDIVMICRPKFYSRVAGGGFLGVWRRMHHRTAEERAAQEKE